jgi:hypothetical protein
MQPTEDLTFAINYFDINLPFMKKFFLYFICLGILKVASAQTDTTEWYGKMNYIFNNIGHAQITISYLFISLPAKNRLTT